MIFHRFLLLMVVLWCGGLEEGVFKDLY